MGETDVVERYLELGLRLGRHVDGFVDAYYGPPGLAARAGAEPPRPPAELAAEAGRLVADLDAGDGVGRLDAGRRRWIRAQAVGLRTSARKLAGTGIGYLDEVESCYGARPALVADDELAAAHRRLDRVLPPDGGAPLRERYIAWREAHAITPGHHGGTREAQEDRLREVRMANHQLAFRQRRELGLGCG